MLRLIILLSAMLPAALAAQETQGFFGEPKVEVRLLSDARTAKPGDTVTVGLHQRIEPGWHTYWRNPGDSGQATEIDWTAPQGVSVAEFSWPYPDRIPYHGLLNYGYENETVLLSNVTIPDDWPTGEPVQLDGRASWLVCEDICIPEEAAVSLTIPTGPTREPAARADQDLIEKFRAQTPVQSPWPIKALEHGERFEIAVDGNLDNSRITDAYFFPNEWGVTDHAAPQGFDVGADGLRVSLIKGEQPPDASLSGLLLITESTGSGELTQTFAVDAAINQAIPAASAAPGIGLFGAALFAFLGGMILNLMPCVFPILSLKALGLVQQAPNNLRQARLHGLSYTAGILLSFLALAGVLLTLRAGGAQLGWGFQLQSPLILTILAYILLVVGLNLSGMFEFGGRLAGVGGRYVEHSGHLGAFATGVLAVIVATPCTAPFMGAALGFAMVQPTPVTLGIFSALGLGFALPYLVLSFMPALGRILPRPGAWMVQLKEFLAFPIYATVAWLLWVLSRQLGSDAFFQVLIGGVLVALAIWSLGLLDKLKGRRGQIAASSFAVVAFVAVIALLPMRPDAQVAAVDNVPAADVRYEVYTSEKLEELRAAGRPVFINLTAAWCITCEVNDRVVLSRERVIEAMEAKDIAYLKGDWTNQDPAITALLAAHGRNGVPLYLIYPGDGGKAEVLPQILTEGIVLDALDRLSVG